MDSQIDVTKIQEAVRQKYAEVSSSAEGKKSFCGVGNPFALGPINSGETILDV